MSARFLHYKLLCFPLKLISTFREILWEYVNILFLIKVLPIDFSVHWLFLPESFITMMVAKWWFPVTLHLLVIFYYKEEFSLFTNLFILVCTHGFFFYSVNYSPLLSLFWCSNSPRLGHWKPPQISSVILICLHHSLSTFLHSGIVICFRLNLYLIYWN